MTRREEIIEKAQCIEHYGMQEQFAFIAGAQWADKTMIEKACEWITNNWREYVYQDGDGIVHFGHWEADFRKSMEE